MPAIIARDMLLEMDSLGGFDEQYFDLRRRPNFAVTNSTDLGHVRRDYVLEEITAEEENWGDSPQFLVCSDPSSYWKKVMLVDTNRQMVMFRSITLDPLYKPKKTIRNGADWWLDNSMIDANVQQMGAMSDALETFLR
ncbi:hypothetical protein [Haliea sp. E17]|uniref:hypothetical protein n=1 Tax=Haliea sp. E17 TaxID=3401576 RepID=UPI003AAD2A3A